MTDTNDAANVALISGTDGYPEMDDQEDIDKYEDYGVYDYARINIEDNIGEPEFKEIYLNLIPDIKAQPFEMRRDFCEKILVRVYEVYDFQFSETIDITSEEAINRVLEFIEFLEYDNILFLSLVWQMLKWDIMKIDIYLMCTSNQNIIIHEIEEQLEAHEQNELISIFLRTYYKSRFIEWFIRESKKSKVSIKLEILEREGKLNA